MQDTMRQIVVRDQSDIKTISNLPLINRIRRHQTIATLLGSILVIYFIALLLPPVSLEAQHRHQIPTSHEKEGKISAAKLPLEFDKLITREQYSHLNSAMQEELFIRYAGSVDMSLACSLHIMVDQWLHRTPTPDLLPVNGIDSRSIADAFAAPRPPTIIDDFQVNENVGREHHTSPDNAVLLDGSTIVTWEDYRNGSMSCIYAQRYNANGSPFGANSIVTEKTYKGSQYRPRIAGIANGGYVITWHEYRRGLPDIYAQIFSAGGVPQGTDLLVNDDGAATHGQYNTDIAPTTDGGFVITWVDTRNGFYDIYVQHFDSSGAIIGSNIKVNDDDETHYQTQPCVATTANGGFVVCWVDYRNENEDIYAQRYDANNAAIGVNFIVNSDGDPNYQGSPSIAGTTDGGIIIAWTDTRDGSNIYAQRYNANGEGVGPNFVINDDDGSAYWDPSVAATMDGGFVVSWDDSRAESRNIYTQRYNAYGITLGRNVQVNDDVGGNNQWEPSVAAGDSGFVICWTDSRGSGNYDIYLQRYDLDGVPKESNKLVNDDEGSSSQKFPSIATTSTGFVIAWDDNRNGNVDIYAQRYADNGTPVGRNFLVNDDGSSDTQLMASVAGLLGGGFVITWVDGRLWQDIYAQRYNADGQNIGANFVVNDDEDSYSKNSPSVVPTADGGFLISWDDGRNGTADIYAQRYNSAGDTVGSNFLVNDNAESGHQWGPSVAALLDGGFIITWLDERNGADIYAQRYTAEGTAIGTNFRVNDDDGSNTTGAPTIAANADGGFLISWADRRDGERDIYAQLYEASGVAAATNFMVNDDEGDHNQNEPQVATSNEGGFVISWNDARNGSNDVYVQHYNATGATLSGNYCASNPSDMSSQQSPSLVTKGDSLILAWQDNRIPGQGWDIYANVLNLNGLIITDLSIPNEPQIHDNITITCIVRDASTIQYVILYYSEGDADDFIIAPMAYDGPNQYSCDIPASSLTQAGLAYYLIVHDTQGNAIRFDTMSLQVQYPSGTITTRMDDGAFPSGFPYKKWRLISLPSDVDVKTIFGTIQDDMQRTPSESSWKLYKYVGPGSIDYQEVTRFAPGEAYFLKQIVTDQELHFSLGSGQSYDINGVSLTLQARKWRFVSAPYPFQVTVDADQGTFIGPYDYGAYGSQGQEGWSVGEVQTTFKPWGGYIVYNNTDAAQTLDIAPSAALGKRLGKADQQPLAGWTLSLTAEGEKYIDAGNVIGRIQGAAEGLDDHDHPEPPYLEGYVSLVVEHPEWGTELPLFTSDVRTLDETNGLWDLDLRTRGETGPIAITCELQGEVPPDMRVVLLDLVQRGAYDLTAGEQPEAITNYSEQLPYRLKVIAGTPDYVQGAIEEALARLPEEFALSQNYPNPFNPSTTIEYALPLPARVSLRVYNLLGREIVALVNDWQDMGYHEIVWQGRDRAGRSVASGVYFAVLQADGHLLTRKMVLLK